MESNDVEPKVSMSPGGLDKKKSVILGVVGLAFIVIIFWKVIPQIGSYSEAATALETMTTSAMALIVGCVLLYLITYGFPFKAATPGLKYWRSQQLNQAAFAISNGVPGGGAVGLAVQFAMLSTFGVPATSATAAITAVGVWSTFVTLLFPVCGVVTVTVFGVSGDSHAAAGFIGLAVLVALVVTFVLVMRSEILAAKVGVLANRLVGPFRKYIKAIKDLDLAAPIIKFRADMYGLLKRRWAALTAAQICVSLTQFLILYVALRGIEGWDNAGTSFAAAFAAFAISQLGLMIPITPGGLGTVDAAMIALLVGFGTSVGDATAAALLWRAASFIPQILIGVIALVAWYRKAGQALAKPTSASSPHSAVSGQPGSQT
ncbi:MAG: flippase-like domain-containing protein [Actinomycetales bacterium]|nr:flippase-like domain-containing protein [Actinomycetales bacterium]